MLKCISHVLGKDVEGDVLAFGVKEEKPAQTVELTGDVHQGKAVGFGNGEVTARLTLNDDGTIAALVIDASTQTPGFGTRCADEEFTAQFIGKSGPFTLNENVDGLTGATITSTAAVEAINAALTSPAMAAEDLEPVATEAPAATEAPMVLENAKTATIAGFGGADITVQVTDENGVITALVVDASSQTAGLGQKCADEAFTSQFIGKSAPLTLGEGIDAVASATITSQAVVDAVN
ncbi:MAG: FMN-binding protein, partial [Christensenellales bacterium]